MKMKEAIEQVIDKLNKSHGGCTCYICNLWRAERLEILALLESAKADSARPDDGESTPEIKIETNDPIIRAVIEGMRKCFAAQQKEIERLKKENNES